jgi:hypothetical protein
MNKIKAEANVGYAAIILIQAAQRDNFIRKNNYSTV